MVWVAGVDGCQSGWFVVLKNLNSGETRHRRVSSIATVLDLSENPERVAIDIPIGLLDMAVSGGRGCDKAARDLLGQPRARSVFSPPVRCALACDDYRSANKANKASSPESVGISIQSFCLRMKLLEVDAWVNSELQERVKEVHPELSFYELNDRRPMGYGKKTPEGLDERRKLLRGAGFGGVISGIGEYSRSEVREDDVLDACVACWSAARILNGDAACIRVKPSCDSRGLRMEILR